MGWTLLISSSLQDVFILSSEKATKDQECMSERKTLKDWLWQKSIEDLSIISPDFWWADQGVE